MPNLNGTGPQGQGPGTGLGRGPCGGGMGWGQGWGRGQGRGMRRGLGCLFGGRFAPRPTKEELADYRKALEEELEMVKKEEEEMKK
ncbi:DUF5320 family protein [Patescibacteria group bacterium]|nr:DUF5320 family protein [Patescibacteria group bacterium]